MLYSRIKMIAFVFNWIFKYPEKEIIPYNQALEIKQLGFNRFCLGWYSDDKKLNKKISFNYFKCRFNRLRCSAPTYYQAFKWFREKWGYASWIEQNGKSEFDYIYSYKIYGRGVFHKPMNSSSISSYSRKYETTELNLLKELIEIVKEIE